ncbi:MCE family protein [Mycobacterium vicinigordonae]|uniref:MCE family protein n=1 Tax=Mycobacterium vicinigordonae TaxID=1719132 RepID=A0A7D6DXV4_9MYCO|nr:MCE family protein [Mycobacterium vicinigordonae]QLL06370.1 MCE family protein [Mycobacterium vicinigordonae]
MRRLAHRRSHVLAVAAVCGVLALSGCGWKGLNSLPLPGTAGSEPGAFTVRAQLPDVNNIQPNSRVRVGDVTVGKVTKIERQGWHALVTMRLDRGVRLPEDSTATVGQTSLLGSLHIELAPPSGKPGRGQLHDGSLIPLSAGAAYPSTEQTLAALSMLLNGGGLGQVQDITEALSTGFAGREGDIRSLIGRLDEFAGKVDSQTGDIIEATRSLNNLVGQIAAQRPVLDRALETIPGALAEVADQRGNLTEALGQLGKFNALVADATRRSNAALEDEINALGPVLRSLGDAGPALTRSLSLLATLPWPNETLEKWVRGDYANLTAIVDLTLSRIDSSLFTGTRWEGNLTELEIQWGRTIGQLPSPYTHTNPLVVPYRWEQGH